MFSSVTANPFLETMSNFVRKIILICGLHGAQSQFFAQLQNVRNLILKNNSIRRRGKVFLDWICEVLEFLRYNV